MTSAVRDVLLVARREIVERARSKAFLISTGLVIAAVLGAMFIPTLFDDDDPTRIGVVEGGPVAAADLAARVAAFGGEVTVEASPNAAAAEASVRADELHAALLPDRSVLVLEELDEEVEQILREAIRQTDLLAALDRAGLPAEQRTQLLSAPAVSITALEPEDAGTGNEETLAVGAVAGVVLYGLLVFYCQMVASGLVEEKASRTVEVLISAVPASRLLIGKILGLGLLGLAQVLAIAAAALAGALTFDVLDLTGAAWLTLGLVVAWFVIGFFLYASLYAVSGALVSRQEDLQSAVMPPTLVLVGAFFFGQWTLNEPGSTVSFVGGLVPFSAPLVQPLRYAAGTAAPWEAPAAIGLCLLTIAVLLPLAVRFYAGSALVTGSRIQLSTAWRASRSA